MQNRKDFRLLQIREGPVPSVIVEPGQTLVANRWSHLGPKQRVRSDRRDGGFEVVEKLPHERR